MHPLSNATTFQLALVVDTLMAQRQLLQLHASLTTHMAGPGSDLHKWMDDRLEEIDATVRDVARVAAIRCDGSEDARADLERINCAARPSMAA